MRRIINLILIVSVVSFFVTQKNTTIRVKSCEEVSNGKDVDWLVHTEDGRILVVPNTKSFTWNAITNYATLNFDSDRDWSQLQNTGEYHVRTYGLRSLFSDNGVKIIRVLDSPDEKPALVVVFNAVKEIGMFVFNGMKDEAIAISDDLVEDVKEFEKNVNDINN